MKTVLEQPVIREMPALLIAGPLSRYDGESRDGISDQWRLFDSIADGIPDRISGASYGLSLNTSHDDQFDYRSGGLEFPIDPEELRDNRTPGPKLRDLSPSRPAAGSASHAG